MSKSKPILNETDAHITLLTMAVGGLIQTHPRAAEWKEIFSGASAGVIEEMLQYSIADDSIDYAKRVRQQLIDLAS